VADIEQSLKELARRIGRLQQQLEQKRSAAGKALAELAAIEKEAAGLLTRIDANLVETRKLKKKLERVKAQRDQAARRLTRSRRQMLQMAKVVFSFGQSVSLRIWLSERHPGEIQRALAYHRYIEAARAKNIQQVLTQLNRLARLQRDYDRRKIMLEQAQDRYTRQLQQYQDKRAQRNRILFSLRQQMQAQKKSLRLMQNRRSELSQVLVLLQRQQQRRLLRRQLRQRQRLQKLRRQAGNRPRRPATGNKHTKAAVFAISPGLRGKPFAGLKGRLPWPTEGNVISYFNRRNSYGKLHAKGVLIAAPSGTGVKSIARGTVVFANWLRGYGMIMIIDHGSQYLTMYGHNRRLLKSVGDAVEAGEKIAEVGDTGGLKRSALYFEIRRRGRPLNPLEWVRVATGKR